MSAQEFRFTRYVKGSDGVLLDPIVIHTLNDDGTVTTRGAFELSIEGRSFFSTPEEDF